MLSQLASRQSLGRVDVLIYCHDGRGLGHLSRSIAIALAIRRIRPTARVVLLTGSEHTPELVGCGRVDWMKLPSYATGSMRRSYPAAAGLLLHDATTAVRSRMIRDIVAGLKPRTVLVDHYPAGKQGELLPALQDSRSQSSLWFLGLRAIVGHNPAIWSKEAQALVRRKYSRLFWYGDSSVTASVAYAGIERHFADVDLFETGYVSRAEELASINALPMVKAVEGLAAFSWCSPTSIRVLSSLASAIATLGSSIASWRVTVGAGASGAQRSAVLERLETDLGCEVLSPDLAFLSCLKCSRVALLQAGYNSLTDLIWAGVPAVVVIREAKDGEQLLHSRALAPRFGNRVLFLREDEASDQAILRHAIAAQAERQRTGSNFIGLHGAERVARSILSSIPNSDSKCHGCEIA